jgi:hypothetical protein
MLALVGILPSILWLVIGNRLPREQAANVIDDDLLPTSEYGKRLAFGGEGQGYGPTTGLILSADEMLKYTYGEFPFQSLDQLLDLVIDNTDFSLEKPLNVVDIGSGCGRLCLYMAMTTNWRVSGIEILGGLHSVAIRARDEATQRCWLEKSEVNDSACGQLSLKLGTAGEFPEILSKADILFTYSTAFDHEGFDTRVGGLILSTEWNEMLTCRCKPGCIAITIDRALSPDFGWKPLARLEVHNREVAGSIGYIQKLERL